MPNCTILIPFGWNLSGDIESVFGILQFGPRTLLAGNVVNSAAGACSIIQIIDLSVSLPTPFPRFRFELKQVAVNLSSNCMVALKLHSTM